MLLFPINIGYNYRNRTFKKLFMNEKSNKILDTNLTRLVNQPYKYGFSTEIEKDTIEKGLNENIIKLISQKKEEPAFMLNFRLKAFKKWKKLQSPKWAFLKISNIDYQALTYYSAPKIKKKLNSLDEVDPELLKTFEKLGRDDPGGGLRLCAVPRRPGLR